MIHATLPETDLFQAVRKQIIGSDVSISTPYHTSIPLVYADWTASGRMYQPIEDRMLREVYPLIANTHTETNFTGKTMTGFYHDALQKIKRHVNATEMDCIICEGSGMTGVVNKFQRILGIKVHESYKNAIDLAECDRPVVFVTHMEHHSNHISWLETLATVRIIPADANGMPDLNELEKLLTEYSGRKHKYASVTAASNVTGVRVDYKAIARMMHLHKGYCFVDFACAAPYVNMDMHPADPLEKLDAIFFSPHKFLGGPGTSGVLIFDRELYHNQIPDHPGGGTVVWTSPYRNPRYFNNIEEREDGGTPGFLQVIRTALAIQLKEQLTVERILEREEEQIRFVLKELSPVDNIHLFASENSNRLCVFSFVIKDLHQLLAVRILNDRFGIQVRGGCSCAGTYGHYLFGIDEATSCSIIDEVEKGNSIAKPGWVRMSVHPVMNNEELAFICNAIKELAANHLEWSKDYHISQGGEITCLAGKEPVVQTIFRPL